MSALPNFFVIGAPRSGSTSLFHYFRQHPDVYMSPVKEPNYFALAGHRLDPRDPGVRQFLRVSIPERDRYLALFEKARTQRAVGEVSVSYLHTPGAAEAIKREVPKARLIAILRHPVERAYTDFMGYRREGLEPYADFRQALRDDSRRRREKWFYGTYLEKGFYHRHLTRYLEHFDRRQLHVCLFEDLRADAAALMRELFTFLGVDSAFVPETTKRYNPTGVLRWPLAQLIWTTSRHPRAFLRPLLPEAVRNQALNLLGGVEKPPLDAELYAELSTLYRQDIMALQDLIGRDLSLWLKAPAP